ncbi:MAG: electron transfer flavoprotein subunit beta/FixA family protein [Deltaproteobacteria bacterium]|nr:electron transfer flavoprotein subunit beta/FixA family protein [Deltaproteobacteria bacterium]
MKIFVCVKHVPDTAANVNIVHGNNFDDSVKFVANPYDEYAIEEAIQIKEKNGGEIVAVSLGIEQASATVRLALAMGADRGIHIKTDALIVDTMTTAQALSKAIEQDGGAELILTGKHSVDCEGMQTQYYLAQSLSLPVATDVIDLALEEGTATVESDLGSGEVAILELDLPCVIGVTKGINEPRLPKIPAIIKAKKKPIQEIALKDLIPEKPAQRANLISLTAAPDKGQAVLFEGSTAEVVDKFVEVLKEKALI